jgi:sigma-E factor negative regulatory protein RseB
VLRTFLLLLLATGQPLAYAGSAHSGPFQWLGEMVRALQDSHYQGNISYRHGDIEQQLRVVHGINSSGGEFDRVVDLSGSEQEIIDQQGILHCRLQQRFSLTHGFDGASKAELPDVINQHLKSSYRLNVEDGGLVAQLMTRQVTVQPRDQLRYGYRFWIAVQEPHLMLRSEMVDVDGTLLEQMAFSSLELLPTTPDKVDESSQQSSRPVRKAHMMPQWRVAMLPPGFKRQQVEIQQQNSEQGRLEHHTFTDGFASLSLFIETLQQEFEPLESRHGALSMVAKQRGEVIITVIGEVPLVTARIVAETTEPLNPSRWKESIK